MDRHPFAERIVKFVVRTHIALYRLLKGRFVGKNIILLTTLGRKSGIERTKALLSINESGDFIGNCFLWWCN